MNSYELHFFAVIEKILEKYLEECKNKFNAVLGGRSHVRQCFVAKERDYFYTLHAQKTWQDLYLATSPEKLQNFENNSQILTLAGKTALELMEIDEGMKLNTSTNIKISEIDPFEEIDKNIEEKLKVSTDTNEFLISKNSSIIMLCHLNDSLEWMSDILFQQLTTTFWSSATIKERNDKFRAWVSEDSPVFCEVPLSKPVITRTSSKDENSDKDKKKSKHKTHHHHKKSEDFDEDTTTETSPSSVITNSAENSPEVSNSSENLIQKVQFISEGVQHYFAKYKILCNKSIFALKLEIRVHCYSYLNFMKTSNYCYDGELSEAAEGLVLVLNNDLARIEHLLSLFLPISKKNYVFEGVSKLIRKIFLSVLASRLEIVKKQQNPNFSLTFNASGIQKMKKNVSALKLIMLKIEQSDPNQVQAVDEIFDDVLQYFTILEMKEEEILASPLFLQERKKFSTAQWISVLSTPSFKRGLCSEAIKRVQQQQQQASQQPNF